LLTSHNLRHQLSATKMSPFSLSSFNQGDQIGHFFAEWVIVYLGLFYENCISSKNFGPLFPRLR
jgi:hypothetical protein